MPQPPAFVRHSDHHQIVTDLKTTLGTTKLALSAAERLIAQREERIKELELLRKLSNQLGTGGGDEGLRAAIETHMLTEACRLQAILDANPPATPVQDEVGEDGAALIAAERRRQVEAEGWTPEHDDGHDEGDLVAAAACYLDPRQWVYSARAVAPPEWPWSRDDWKPACSSDGPESMGKVTAEDYIRNLTKAGALVAAEIDRLQRSAAAQPEPHQGPDCNCTPGLPHVGDVGEYTTAGCPVHCQPPKEQGEGKEAAVGKYARCPKCKKGKGYGRTTVPPATCPTCGAPLETSTVRAKEEQGFELTRIPSKEQGEGGDDA